MRNEELYRGSTLIELILLGLRRTPERLAIVDEYLSLSYRELEQRIMRFASVFNDLGLQKGEGIAQLASNRVDTFVTMSAALLNGLRYTPLHPMGSLEDQLFILQDANISALVVDVPYFQQRGSELAQQGSALGHVLTLGPAEFGEDLLALAEKASNRQLEPVPEADDLAWVSYTGGTTGKPKGVMMSHQAMATNSLISLGEWQWPEEIRYLASSPISHAAGFLLIPTFLKGGTVYLVPGFDPDLVLDMVEQHRINTLFLVPTMIYVLMDHPRTREADTSSLETIVYASAPMSPTRLEEALNLFGPVFFQCYGQTESIHITALRKEDHSLEHKHRLASCGKPPGGIRLTLLDKEGNAVPQGEIGQVSIRGLPVMEGYWNREEETEEAFANGWLNTGDMAYCDEDGYYYLVDRAKDMIISGGFNVYPKEVEDVLTTHPAVSMAAVIGVPDDKWGEKVTAVVVCKDGQAVDESDLVALVKEKKGSIYTPKTVDFIAQLPLTALGKADKKALRKRYWANQERMVS